VARLSTETLLLTEHQSAPVLPALFCWKNATPQTHSPSHPPERLVEITTGTG
jgi:hypothetical protein